MKPETEVVLGYDQDNSGVWNQFASAITEQTLHHGRKATVSDATYDFSDADGTIIFTKTTQAYFYSVDLNAAGYVFDNRNQRTVTISVAARTQEDAIAYMAELKSRAKIEKMTDETLVNVNFWSMTSYGGNFRSRKLTVPAWEEIAVNYPGETQEELSLLMDKEFRPGSGGQLILWYGEPGTGKTTALRALAREWKDWCNVEYIADPEKFFGSETEYMLSVLIKDEDEDVAPWQTPQDIDPEADEKQKWRLLVLEDAGELLAHDAKMLSGAGLGRFLNVVDGLIGQGLKIIVLVTTNEELGHFHDAVSRPGRCLAQIEFSSFTESEAEEWLEGREAEDASVDGDKTLAELYAKLHKHEHRTPKALSSFGFGS